MNLIEHAHISDEEFVKTILSSGDFFPGFYRFTMGDRNEEEGQLTIPGLVAAFFDQKKHDWTAFTNKRLECADTRNRERSDDAVYELIKEKYTDWMLNAGKYDVAVIEIDNGDNKINPYRTYFFMGSLIRFTETHLQVGYDALREKSLLSIPYDYSIVRDYTHKIYGMHLADFFLPADLVATIDTKTGKVKMSDDTIARVMTAHSNSILIASNRDRSKDLPIRWAKDILLTDYVH